MKCFWRSLVQSGRSIKPFAILVRCAAVWLVWSLNTAISADEHVSANTAASPRFSLTDLKRHCVTLASDAFEGREAGSVGGHAASAYLLTELRKIPGIQGAGIADGWVQEFGSNFRNILVVLPGSDPTLRQEIILVGAHYDHVGRGNPTNSRGPFGYIHNGADDNASGTAALLELIKAFAAMNPAPRRTMVFAFWDAEEMGLLGSRHWVAHPTRPLKDIKMVLNIDMLGRLREGRLIVVGWRSAPGLRSRLVALNPLNDLDYKFEPKVIADSDHYHFYAAGIPALHLDTGKHEDYHRPTDDADKLNFPGIVRLTDLAFHLAHDAAMEPATPVFRREALTEAAPAWITAAPAAVAVTRLGVTFDSKQFDANRAIVSQVTPGSPAATAGIRPLDQIVSLAHWENGTVVDMKTVVQIARNPVTVVLQRPNVDKPVELQVSLLGEPVRVGIRWQLDAALPGNFVITQVISDSPADRAGLKSTDMVIPTDDQPIPSEEDFRHLLMKSPSPIHLRVERNGQSRDVAIELFEPSQQER